MNQLQEVAQPWDTRASLPASITLPQQEPSVGSWDLKSHSAIMRGSHSLYSCTDAHNCNTLSLPLPYTLWECTGGSALETHPVNWAIDEE